VAHNSPSVGEIRDILLRIRMPTSDYRIRILLFL
jgi:hypothetical protein